MSKLRLWVISTLFKALNAEKYKIQEVERVQRTGKLLSDLKKLKRNVEKAKSNLQTLEDEVREIIYHENVGINILESFSKKMYNEQRS